MGMNIYTLNRKNHIGKRYAAGIWCWDCKKQMIEGDSYCCDSARKFFEDKKEIKYNPAFRELGFDNKDPKAHRGVDGASGFIWRLGDGLGNTIGEIKETLGRRKYVLTEYGERWEIQKFWDMFKDIIKEQESDYEFS